MSLYNMLFGSNEAGPDLIELLQKVRPMEVGRYRDAWVERDGDSLLIRVHTRNGGGNRECWCEGDEHYCLGDAIDSMQAHPWYVSDADDEFDCTYADFFFRPDPARIDQTTAQQLVELAGDPVDMGEAWRAVIDAIRNSK